MPFWSDNNIPFLAGKGSGNIRYYADPQRGMCFLPRRALIVRLPARTSRVSPVRLYIHTSFPQLNLAPCNHQHHTIFPLNFCRDNIPTPHTAS
ncbi:hypothetical protein EDD18DRAFT_1139464 [Armillaria luteobubalina]|uniref:Uncharacterized protein n=1 Tax=Armillaria luteobubalina TaxID=153913 RepID=A0AA39QFW6_9AGAR|nr:hypothetical protein EDD18DRAFT_1139464 [Armillaria luteobubalina]